MKQTLAVFARLTAKAGRSEELGDQLRSLIDPTRTESGSIEYLLHRDNEDPNAWMLYETWRSRADLDAHFEKPYVRAVMQRFPELLASDMQLHFCTPIPRTRVSARGEHP